MKFGEIMQIIEKQSKAAVLELIQKSKLTAGDILVIGCSSSEICGKTLGTSSSIEAAEALYNGVIPVLQEHKIHLAVQCCEHLNRAIVIEKKAIEYREYTQLNAKPVPHAGGAFASVCYNNFESPVLIESIQANAGMDIGNVLIGMQIKAVAVPIRLSINKIGEANLICARSRPRFIGGERAVYDTALL